METRRTNQFLRVALGTRSPARAKLFKGKFHDIVANETKINFNSSNVENDLKPKTSYLGTRRDLKPLSRDSPHRRNNDSIDRAQTTKDRRRGNSTEYYKDIDEFADNN